MRTISYPILLQLAHADQIMIAVGHTRVNLSDRSKNTIEEILFTGWIEPEKLTDFQKRFLQQIHSSRLSFSNFYRFYDSLVDQVILLNASKWADFYLDDRDAKEVKQISDRIGSLESKIEGLRVELKKE